MKNLLLLACFAFTFSASCASCKKDERIVNGNDPAEITNSKPKGTKMKITIGSRSFTATLYNNPAATAFKALLPLTIQMTELNGNEKYAELSRSLPVDAVNPDTIHNGDLMLYGSTTLVVFYKSFPTSYKYTRLGKIEDPTGLAGALGAGNISVAFNAE